jgi:prevent-host-death family protein
MGTWQLQEAKAKLSEVIKTAKKEGPQIISQRGVKSAVVLPFDEWELSQQPKGQTFLEILRSGPSGDLPLPPRNRWKMRKPVEL